MALSAAEWARVEDLFAQAAGLDAAARARLLERECGQHPRVRAEVEALLEASGTADPLLDGTVALAPAAPRATPDRLPAGTRLGAWRIRSLIGHGGMGEVYLAERADGAYAMNAAIKLLKQELFSFDNAQRFLRERRVLARLSHPNIARVLDAGTSDDGRPYLVMEYAEGARITEHARARRLTPRACAELLLGVVEAVAEAHQRGVIHRDLKPANVIVAADGRVKLLDFGIAKLLDEEAAATPGAVPLTPAYAAPEQLRNEALTPATDVYALGVMLHQLVHGTLPHGREGLPLPVIAAQLAAEALPLPAPGADDLGWIAWRALQPDPQRRYADAAALAGDLRRYLDRRPVAAHPGGPAYRLRLLLRRHPVPAALLLASALLAAALLAALRT